MVEAILLHHAVHSVPLNFDGSRSVDQHTFFDAGYENMS